MSSVAEDTDMISTAGSPGDTTGASIATDVTDSEEVIQPRASRSRSTTKRGSTAAVKTEEQEAVSPIKAKSSRKGSTQVKPGVAKEEVQPGVQAKDFGAAVQK